MEKALENIIEKALRVFPESFINRDNELILEPTNNVYFRLEDMQTELEFKCKLMAWVSRPIAKGLEPKWSKQVLASLNDLLNTKFSKAHMQVIYTELGNDVNPELSVQFIESGYDLSLLEFRKWFQGA